MKKILAILPALLLSILVGAQSEKYADISKYSDIYHSVLRELELNYVDSLKHDQLTESAIGRMLYALDPYTTYYPESKEEEVRRLRSGEYGGIGSVVTQQNDGVYIGEPYEGMPAQKAGLMAGDKILEIDGVKIEKKTVSDVSDLLRGTPGTPIVVKVQRKGEKSPLTFKFTRDVIQMPSVPYWGVLSDSIGYIVINEFVERTSADFKHAMHEMVNQNHITSLIIDLRDNGGGLVDQAVSIAGLFLPRNSPVLTMKGRMLKEDIVHRTTGEPLYPNMPLVVMVNGSTASASEVLAGAFQDYDRAVIVGERSFGKGLVQSMRRVPYNGYVKITTAKYYTPSGRCLQAIDYALRQNNERERQIPDSLTNVFKTANGRTVRDGCGILPDSLFTRSDNVNISYYLYNKNILFDYATEFRLANPTIPNMFEFGLTDAQYDDFVNYVKNQNFTYRLESEKYLQDLKEVVKIEGYDELTDSLFNQLTAALQPNVATDLYRFKKEVLQWLEYEIIKRYYYQKGGIVNSMKFDGWLKRSIFILQHPQDYRKMLMAEQK